MVHDMHWQRAEAEDRIRDVLDAARAKGVQTIADGDGVYHLTFVARKKSLHDLFSKPGPLEPDGEER